MKSWFLHYLTDAPRQPSLWTVVGSTVHQVTEAYDLEVCEFEDDWDATKVAWAWKQTFNLNMARSQKDEPRVSRWKQSPSEPLEVWADLGPKLVQSYIDWRKRSPYEIWTTPDGKPAIELDISGRLPGCDVEIWAFLDRVFHDPILDQLVIVDLKTSKRPPAKADQFAVYAALLEVKYKVRARLGAAFMNRRGTLSSPWALADFTPEAIGEVFADAWKKIQAGSFPANPGKACFLCDHSAACAAVGGPLAREFDPDHPDNIPF